MLFPMHFFESRAYERSAPPPAAVNFHVIFFLCIWWQDYVIKFIKVIKAQGFLNEVYCEFYVIDPPPQKNTGTKQIIAQRHYRISSTVHQQSDAATSYMVRMVRILQGRMRQTHSIHHFLPGIVCVIVELSGEKYISYSFNSFQLHEKILALNCFVFH